VNKWIKGVIDIHVSLYVSSGLMLLQISDGGSRPANVVGSTIMFWSRKCGSYRWEGHFTSSEIRMDWTFELHLQSL